MSTPIISTIYLLIVFGYYALCAVERWVELLHLDDKAAIVATYIFLDVVMALLLVWGINCVWRGFP